MLAGQQDKIYDNFFRLCSQVLPKGGRLFLQTMMWGKRVPSYPDDFNVDAPKLSDAWVLGHVEKFYAGGGWLPNGLDHIKRVSKPYFKFVSSNNGRKDYIQTMDEWGKALNMFSLRKELMKLKLVPRYLTNRDFRCKITALRHGCNMECFKREIMSHERMFFEKV